MSLKVYLCYPLIIPQDVLESTEQEVYESIFGDESGETDINVFINPDDYPSLNKYLISYGKQEKLKLYIEAKLKG